MQITTGVRAVLSHPAVYSAFQYLMGARSGWIRLMRDHVQASPGDLMLDIGCGPGDALRYLPAVRYWGYDVSAEYIERARARFGDRGDFFCKIFDESDVEALPRVDIALLSGVLHHLGDDDARNLFLLLRKAVKPGGRVVCVDPCFAPGQNLFARLLISNDRGCDVRDAAGYARLAEGVFESVNARVRHKAWIPYTHCYMVCS